jgi:NADH-quinone oxidoreductase subunit H
LNLIGATILVLKACLLVFVQIWVRWTLPRLRIDQVMTTCLKYLIPISCVLFLGATLWPLLLASVMGRTTWTPPLGRSAVKTSAAIESPASHQVLATAAQSGGAESEELEKSEARR